MTGKTRPKCSVCETGESFMWRQIDGEISSSATPTILTGQICQDCYRKTIKTDGNEEEKQLKSPEVKKLRKSTRISKKLYTKTGTTITNSGGGGGASAAGWAGGGGKAGSKGGKIKRLGLKKNFKPAPIQLATKYVTSVTHQGSKIKVGDIVSLMDAHDNLFYAQVRGLTVDMYCDKHAYITWLIPTQASPPPNERFDASTYLIGHDEDTPRSLNLLEFVMHAPSSYFHDKAQPLPLEAEPTGFTWTRHKRGVPTSTATTVTCTVTSGAVAVQNVVTTTTATVTISNPAETVTEMSAAPLTDNGAVTSTTTTTTTAVAADSSTASEQ